MASINKFPSGWQYRISYKDRRTGKYATKSKNGFKTKAECEVAAARVNALLLKNKSINHHIVFMDYFKNWFDLFHNGQQSIEHDKEVKLSIKFAQEFFGETKILDLDRNKMQEFVNWIADGGEIGTAQKTKRSKATVIKRWRYVRQCLQDAYHDGIIHTDITYNIKLKGVDHKKKESEKFLSEKDARAVMRVLNNRVSNPSRSYSRYMMIIGLGTGMRISEVLALGWSAIDFEKQTIDIAFTYDYKETKEFKPTKNKKMRTVSVGKEVLKRLKEYKEKGGWKDNEYLFLKQSKEDENKYEMLVTYNKINKYVKKTCELAGIEETITFHGLRHTYASICLYKRFHIHWIAKQLGHESVSTTEETYAHVIKELNDEENEFAQEVFDSIMTDK
ncbi:MAG TPA: site-specific integrase [Candidatus Tetragenococcus pullicola]|nr:site-specific integrase [Candidatus Tetragenococcus pullicola]